MPQDRARLQVHFISSLLARAVSITDISLQISASLARAGLAPSQISVFICARSRNFEPCATWELSWPLLQRNFVSASDRQTSSRRHLEARRVRFQWEPEKPRLPSPDCSRLGLPKVAGSNQARFSKHIGARTCFLHSTCGNRTAAATMFHGDSPLFLQSRRQL